ncbi:MAG: nitroreductase family protein [Armatimonadetes bacterium]|nr:nitroreductase family protein [Armatimonadota bacterium]
MDAIECLKTRRSVRAYQNRPVPKEIIEDIVDCGRLAASAINVQPWAFVAVTDSGVKKQIADISDHGQFIEQAGACIAVFCLNGKYYLEDGSAATQNILNAARAHGLGSCWVAGDKKEYAPRIGQLLGVPEDRNLVSLIAVGYPEQTPSPAKRALAEVLHWERFGGCSGG